MDLHRFDNLAKSLSVSGSRRRTLVLIAALPLAGLGAAPDTDARNTRRRKPNGRKKDKDKGKGKRNGDGTPPPPSQERLSFCKDGQTITAPASKQDTLLARGATLGACEEPDGTCAATGEACSSSNHCCGEEVCGGGKTNRKVCRPNHRPTAFNLSIRNPWRSPCVPITFLGFEHDHDLAQFRIASLPVSGFLTEYISRSAGNSTPAQADISEAGHARTAKTPLPAPPPIGDREGCTHENLSRSPWYPGDDGSLTDTAAVQEVCPGGWFLAHALCYVPFQSTFTGFDSFTYVLVDEFGAESEPAAVNFEIYET